MPLATEPGRRPGLQQARSRIHTHILGTFPLVDSDGKDAALAEFREREG
jgi:hypothetical protein